MPRVLIIAGSDSGGGAGIQADIKTVTMLGGYAMTAVTAITVQNTLGVSAVHPVPDEIVAAQIEAVLSDIGVDAVKTGMLGSASLIGVIADALAPLAGRVPIIVDPVMTAKGGAALLPRAAEGALRERLLPLASLLTPNIPEAERLLGRAFASFGGADAPESALAAMAGALRALGPAAVLLKGGHLDGPRLVDCLDTPAGLRMREGQRLATRHTHGTGCTLASAMAVLMAGGRPLEAAFAEAHAYVRAAIAAAPGFGAGHGPLDHGHPLRSSKGDPKSVG
ncbi:MAG: bifunctional hydroxymethylpyrimidine kinase/phosphomethylpyrimidine kinase [Alphaproteobacteria bacterium]|nr:bifunctional hydroxymethylpyrimidine kinase/phosphomethylpyrimidine kinase [Alphaproteobacteria bacterium]